MRNIRAIFVTYYGLLIGILTYTFPYILPLMAIALYYRKATFDYYMIGYIIINIIIRTFDVCPFDPDFTYDK